VVDPHVWHKDVSQQVNNDWFDAQYTAPSSFWVRLFESLNNRRTWRRLCSYFSKPEGKQLLEIGVGSGSFLRMMRHTGFQVTGCDLSETVCRHVEHTLGISMYNGSISAIPQDALFDLIVMNHVLEHVTDPVGFLQAVSKKLRAGGILHLAVPNIEAWEAGLKGWVSYQPYHMLYFSSQTLQHTVEKAGMNLSRQFTHESFSGWFLAFLRTLIAMTRRASTSSPTGHHHTRLPSYVEHPYRVAMVMCGLLSYPMRCIQQYAGYGDEILVIATQHDGEVKL
jgi:2-polyprenyl-3-methyl-5-hydroxy-6-metoxy-1,4-benzoquinol methylase